MQCGVKKRMIRRHEAVVVKCFKYGEKGHKYRECPLWGKKESVVCVASPQKVYPVKGKVQEGERRLRRVEEKEAVHVAKPQEAQQGWRRSSIEELRKRAEEHCGRGVPEEAQLLELGYCTREVVVSYLTCERYESQGCHVEGNRGQRVISKRKSEEIKWCGCIGEAVRPKEAKAQQGSVQLGEPESTAKEGDSQREVRRTFKMLREVWLNVGVEKLNTHEGITVKALLDNGATGMFMDKRMVARHRFKLQKLERPIMVRDVDGTNNGGGAITYQVEVNIYYKGHVERMRMDVCNLEKIEIILGMLWLTAHNPEIN